jgi:predicted ester cyclase
VPEAALDKMRAFWERAFNGRDLGALDGLIADEYVNHAALPGTPPGREGQAQLMQRLWSAFPDAHFTIEHLVQDGDTVICVGTMEGTHEGELLGQQPSGRRVQWRQCHVVKVDGEGRALEHRGIRDDLGLFRQMGGAPG